MRPILHLQSMMVAEMASADDRVAAQAALSSAVATAVATLREQGYVVVVTDAVSSSDVSNAHAPGAPSPEARIGTIAHLAKTLAYHADRAALTRSATDLASECLGVLYYAARFTAVASAIAKDKVLSRLREAWALGATAVTTTARPLTRADYGAMIVIIAAGDIHLAAAYRRMVAYNDEG